MNQLSIERINELPILIPIEKYPPRHPLGMPLFFLYFEEYHLFGKAVHAFGSINIY